MTIAALVLAVAVVVTVLLTVSWRWSVQQARELKMAHALGKNVGMTVKELEVMRHPHTVYDHRRLTKFMVELPAHLIGELHHPDKRADVEAKLRATIRGVMGYVTVDFDHARTKRPHGTVTLTQAVIPKPIPTFVDAKDLR